MNFYCTVCKRNVEGIRGDIVLHKDYKERVICLECGTSYVIKNDAVFKTLNGLTHRDEINIIEMSHNKSVNHVLHLERNKK